MAFQWHSKSYHKRAGNAGDVIYGVQDAVSGRIQAPGGECAFFSVTHKGAELDVYEKGAPHPAQGV